MLNVRLHIEVIDGETGATEDYSLDPSEGPILIGRDRNSRVVLASPSVSRKHCTFEPDEAGWVIIDTSSLGTRLNGKPLPKGQRKRIQHGDELEVANYKVNVSIVALTDPTLKPDPMALRRLMDEVRNEAVHPCVWVFLPGTSVKEHFLPEERASLTVGRSAECDVILPDPMRVVSSFHAKIERSFAGVFLYDTSTNGIFVNGEKVDNGVALSDGDRITVAVAEEDLARPLLVFTAEGNSSTPEGPKGAGMIDSGGLVGVASGAAGSAGSAVPKAKPENGDGADAERRGAFAEAGDGKAKDDDGGRSFFGGGSESADDGGAAKARGKKRPSRNSLIEEVEEAGGKAPEQEKRSVLAEVQKAIADVEQEEAQKSADAEGSGASVQGGAAGAAAGSEESGAAPSPGGARSNVLLIVALAISGLAIIVVIIWGIILMRG